MRLTGGNRVSVADCERRERQRKMKNDEAPPSRGRRARSFSAASNRRPTETLLPPVSREAGSLAVRNGHCGDVNLLARALVPFGLALGPCDDQLVAVPCHARVAAHVPGAGPGDFHRR